MAEANVADRLKTFIEAKGLTYSQFADTCGIPRPSLSQLMTKRNKKISDVLVGQIHNMFPELSILWLLFGEGPMENWEDINKSTHSTHRGDDEIKDGLFSIEESPKSESKKIVFSSQRPEESKFFKDNGLRNYPESSQASDLKIEKLQSKIKELQSQIDNLKKNPRKVSHITVYYDDSTFETFFPR